MATTLPANVPGRRNSAVCRDTQQPPDAHRTRDSGSTHSQTVFGSTDQARRSRSLLSSTAVSVKAVVVSDPSCLFDNLAAILERAYGQADMLQVAGAHSSELQSG